MACPDVILGLQSTAQVQFGNLRPMKNSITKALFCLAATVLVALSQDTRGTILGRVTDASGGNVANAEVRATNLATGVTVSAKTNDSGNYLLPYLPPGVY